MTAAPIRVALPLDTWRRILRRALREAGRRELGAGAPEGAREQEVAP